MKSRFETDPQLTTAPGLKYRGTAIYVNDVPAALDFYRRVCGSYPDDTRWQREKKRKARCRKVSRQRSRMACCAHAGKRSRVAVAYAIFLLLARLGLRASEVTQLTLDDIDWRAADPVFTNARGQPLSRDGIQYILTQQEKKREQSVHH